MTSNTLSTVGTITVYSDPMRQLSIQITILKKVNHYRSMYGLQHGALAHTEQQAIKGPKIV